MGQLRQRMEEDLKLRRLSKKTRATYLRCAVTFVRHYRRSPAEMGREEIRDFLLHLIEDRKYSPSTYNVHAAALRFLYTHTLQRPEEVAWVAQMRVPQRPARHPQRRGDRAASSGARLAEDASHHAGGVRGRPAHQRGGQPSHR